MAPARQASLFLFAVSGTLLLGALAFQHIGGLAPCEMCYWQRYGHLGVLVLALSGMVSGNRILALLAILAMLLSAGLGGFHMGVEQGWWPSPTGCTANFQPGMSQADMLAGLLETPLVRCDEIPWSLMGLSMAGWNALISAMAAIGGLILWRRA
ncbi:disulfide bond formation protein B [Sandaracinobacteroides sp. A072]|uniref:disulfide bond formation protein B n=1 Tax=Sandaracinobacteroides sp. A072 TaxID=3461146 RepID=UPI004041996B